MYIIPPNYSPKGMLMGKDIRNYIEMAVVAILLGGLILSLPISFKAKIYIAIIVLLPALLVTYFGINGLSFGMFVMLFFKYRKSTKEYGMPTAEDRIKRKKMLLKKKKKTEALRKRQELADKKAAHNMARKEKKYAEQRRKKNKGSSGRR